MLIICYQDLKNKNRPQNNKKQLNSEQSPVQYARCEYLTSESALSDARCAGPDFYCQISKFQVNLTAAFIAFTIAWLNNASFSLWLYLTWNTTTSTDRKPFLSRAKSGNESSSRRALSTSWFGGRTRSRRNYRSRTNSNDTRMNQARCLFVCWGLGARRHLRVILRPNQARWTPEVQTWWVQAS